MRGGEDAHRLGAADHEQALQDLLVGELGVAHDRASRLDGLDDLGGGVAGEREPRRVAVNLHCPPQRLLRARRHAACAPNSNSNLDSLS